VNLRARELRRLYERVTLEMKTLVDEADPVGPLALDCPDDEYADEGQ
jgi:hypothetical protein